MIIDIATHVYPRPVFDRVKRIAPNFGSMGTRIDNTRQLYEFDDRFRLMDEAGEYVQIVSFSSPPIEEFMTPEQGNEIARFLALPEAKEKFNAAGGFEPWNIRPEEFSAAIRRDYDKYGKLAKDIGVRVD